MPMKQISIFYIFFSLSLFIELWTISKLFRCRICWHSFTGRSTWGRATMQCIMVCNIRKYSPSSTWQMDEASNTNIPGIFFKCTASWRLQWCWQWPGRSWRSLPRCRANSGAKGPSCYPCISLMLGNFLLDLFKRLCCSFCAFRL